MVRPPDATRRARTTLLTVLVVTVGVVASATAAAGQEAPAPGATTTTTAPTATTTSTTSTTAPPVTVVLEGGDIGVLPPGATDPSAPTTPPPDPAAGPQPPDGERPVPDELPVVILPDPTPGLNAALAAIDVTRARDALDAADTSRREADDALRAAFTHRADAVAARRAAGDALLAAKSVVDNLAVNAVMYGDVSGLEPILTAPSLQRLRDLTLSDAVAEQLFDDLDAAKTGYRDAVAAELGATRDLTRATTFHRLVETEYLHRRDDLDASIAKAEDARRQIGPTILGPSALESADLVAWYRTYYPTDPPVAPIETIIDTYLRIGAEEGVAGDIAFAQAILETGGFRSGHAGDFNFAGIGAFDYCAPSCAFHFRDLDDGVRAHIQLLRAYADPGLTSDQLATPPDPVVAPERVGVRGCCPRWTALTGIWASDPNYDRKVLGIYRLMVETARARDRLSL